MFISSLNLSQETITRIDFAINKGRFPECIMEIVGPMRERLFEVTGVTNPDVLPALRAIMDRSLKGESIEKFKKDLNAAAFSKWGPLKDNSRVTETLCHTYSCIAYAVMRYIQMRTLESHPHWRYVYGDSQCGHKNLDGLVIPANDPWWNTHYPPNGFECDCYVTALMEGQPSRKDIKAAKRKPTLDFSPEWVYVCTGVKTLPTAP